MHRGEGSVKIRLRDWNDMAQAKEFWQPVEFGRGK